jgi:hypothetical protein
MAGLVSSKRVVLAAYNFESGEEEEKLMSVFRAVWEMLGKK